MEDYCTRIAGNCRRVGVKAPFGKSEGRRVKSERVFHNLFLPASSKRCVGAHPAALRRIGAGPAARRRPVVGSFAVRLGTVHTIDSSGEDRRENRVFPRPPRRIWRLTLRVGVGFLVWPLAGNAAGWGLPGLMGRARHWCVPGLGWLKLRRAGGRGWSGPVVVAMWRRFPIAVHRLLLCLGRTWGPPGECGSRRLGAVAGGTSPGPPIGELDASSPAGCLDGTVQSCRCDGDFERRVDWVLCIRGVGCAICVLCLVFGVWDGFEI